MVNEQYQYLRDIAESFIKLDHQLDAYLRGSAEIIGSDMPDVPIAVVYGILKEGAVVHKYHELVRAHEEAISNQDLDDGC